MSDVRTLLRRVQRLEQRLRPPKSPIEITYGSFSVFEDGCRAKIKEGRLDPIDVPIILRALKSWTTSRRR
jgi:hypothetical protein